MDSHKGFYILYNVQNDQNNINPILNSMQGSDAMNCQNNFIAYQVPNQQEFNVPIIQPVIGEFQNDNTSFIYNPQYVQFNQDFNVPIINQTNGSQFYVNNNPFIGVPQQNMSIQNACDYIFDTNNNHDVNVNQINRTNQDINFNQNNHYNQDMGLLQVMGSNQGMNVNPIIGPNQDINFNQNNHYNQDMGSLQVMGSNQGMNVNPIIGPNQDINLIQNNHYNQDMNFNQNNTYNQNMNVNPVIGFNQDMNFNKNNPYNQNMNVNPVIGSNQNMNFNKINGSNQNINVNPIIGSNHDMYYNQINVPIPHINFDEILRSNQDMNFIKIIESKNAKLNQNIRSNQDAKLNNKSCCNFNKNDLNIVNTKINIGNIDKISQINNNTENQKPTNQNPTENTEKRNKRIKGKPLTEEERKKRNSDAARKSRLRRKDRDQDRKELILTNIEKFDYVKNIQLTLIFEIKLNEYIIGLIKQLPHEILIAVLDLYNSNV